MYEFNLGTKVFYGTGCRSVISSILKDNSWSNLGVVVDHNISGNDKIKDLLSVISKLGVHLITEPCTVSEPTYDFLDIIRDKFNDSAIRVIVGIGGGSTLDTAKAIAVLINNKEPAIAYRGFNKMTGPVLPVIAIPTTAGTGSEVTPNASFVDVKEKRKMGINGEAIKPRYAILDPELTVSCPAKPSISAGVDSMVHAIEAYVAQKTNPLSRLLAKEGFKHVFLNLPLVIKEPQNIKYRDKVMYGAFLSGIALMNSGTGPAAAMSYPLSVHFKIPHGIGGGIFLPYVIRYNVKNGYDQYADLYESVVDLNCMENIGKNEKAQLFVEEIFLLWKALAIPDDLTKLGITHDFLPRFVQDTLELKGALEQNPVLFSEDAIISVLKELKV